MDAAVVVLRALLVPVGTAVGAAVVFVVLVLSSSLSDGAPVATDRSRAAVLIDRHECWSGAAPRAWEGVTPAGVVMTRPGTHSPVHLTSQRAVDRALAHVFAAPEPGMWVHGFCAR